MGKSLDSISLEQARNHDNSTVVITMKPDVSGSDESALAEEGNLSTSQLENLDTSTPKLTRRRCDSSTIVISMKPDIESESEDQSRVNIVGESEKPQDRVRNYIQTMLEDYDQVQDFIADDKMVAG